MSNGEHNAVSELSPNRVLDEFISFFVCCGRGFVASVASWLPWLRGFVAAAVASNQDLNFKEQRAR